MMIPSGMFRSGSFISSATLVTFITPAYATNTSDVAARKLSALSTSARLLGSEFTTFGRLTRMTSPSTAIITTTMMFCACPAPSELATLIPVNNTVRTTDKMTTADSSIGPSDEPNSSMAGNRKTRYGRPPIRASAVLKFNTIQFPTPATVPTTGPIPRWM